MLFNVRQIFWVMILLVTPALVAGQSKEEEELPAYTGDEVSVVGERYDFPTISDVATKLPTPLHTTPASVSVITRSQIEDQGGVTLSDAMRQISGTNVQTNFGVHDFFVIRGFESLSGGLVVTDGVADPGGSYFNLYNVEQVDVLKGPGAFLYGGDPLSGTVSLSRKQPLFQRFMRVNGSFGRFNAGRGTLDLGVADEETGTAFRLNMLTERSDGYRDDKKNSAFAINPAFTWKPTNESMLRLNLEYADSRFKSDAGLPLVGNALPDVSRSRSYQAPFDHSDQETFRFRMDYQIDITSALTLRNKVYYTNFAWDSQGTLFNGAMPTTPGDAEIFRSMLILDDRQQVFGNQLEAALSFKTGTFQHTMLAGFEALQWKDEFTLDVAGLPSISLQSPIETATEPLFLIPGQSTAADSRNRILAPYIVDQIAFSDKFQAFIGGRIDDISYKDPSTATHRTYSKFSPMAGLVFIPKPDLSLYVSAGNAFAAPSSRVVGDKKAESSKQFEAGIKEHLLNGKLRANVAFYWLNRDNINIPTDVGFTAELGDQRSRGVELELAIRPISAWTTFLSWAYLDAELTRFSEQIYVPTPTGMLPQIVDHSGNTPAFAPSQLLNLWTSYHWRNGFGLGAGIRYTGSQFIAEDNAYDINAAMTCDAAMFYTYGPLRWRLNLKNITNTRTAIRGFGSYSVIPAAPFNAVASIEWSL